MSSSDPNPPEIGRQMGLRRTAARAGHVARAALAVIRANRWVLRAVLRVLVGIVIVFEEWGWRPLSRLAAWLAHFAPMAALEARIAALPPYGALAVFAVPSILLVPLKLLALWLVAGGHALSAGLLFVGAKVVGTALVARLFHLTEPALMQLWWFRAAYERVMPWKEALLAEIRASTVWRQGRVLKWRAQQKLRHLAAELRPHIQPMIDWVRERMRQLGNRR